MIMMLMMPGHGDAPDADVAERRMVKISRRRSRRQNTTATSIRNRSQKHAPDDDDDDDDGGGADGLSSLLGDDGYGDT
jgi:hypothetical protein